MKNFLGFLSSKDRETLIKNSTVRKYSDGDVILKQGDKNTTLYIIAEGCVSVVSHIMDHDMEIERLYKDDVLGDLSFVDSEPVSADVISDGDTTIHNIGVEGIQGIIRSDPLFYGRFYQAIAKVLSHRMREENRKAELYMGMG